MDNILNVEISNKNFIFLYTIKSIVSNLFNLI